MEDQRNWEWKIRGIDNEGFIEDKGSCMGRISAYSYLAGMDGFPAYAMVVFYKCIFCLYDGFLSFGSFISLQNKQLCQ